MSDFEKHVYLAKVAEQAERYKDMVDHVKAMAEATDKPLEVEQRNLLSVAYKNVVGACRASWRALNAQEQAEESKEGSKIRDFIRDYRTTTVEKELRDVSADLLAVVDKLLETDKDTSGQVFFLKMKGDYYRYLAEIEVDCKESEKTGVEKKAADAYTAASEVAEKDMAATSPIRLGLALNMSVFYYEILRERTKAQELAKKAFDDAISHLDTLNDDDYKDATLIMQLIRDNLTLWASEDEEQNE